MKCFSCNRQVEVEREACSNACLRCGEREMARLYPKLPVEAPKVRRCWMAHSVESQTVHASGSVRYRGASGSYFYVNSAIPGRAFKTRRQAVEHVH